jgi:hypothetical protein
VRATWGHDPRRIRVTRFPALGVRSAAGLSVRTVIVQFVILAVMSGNAWEGLKMANKRLCDECEGEAQDKRRKLLPCPCGCDWKLCASCHAFCLTLRVKVVDGVWTRKRGASRAPGAE